MKKGEYIATKCHNTPGVNYSRSYEINIPCNAGKTSQDWLIWEDKLLKALEIQGNSIQPQRYTFTECLLTGEANATFTLAALDIGIHNVENFNKVLVEMTKHAFLQHMLSANRTGTYVGT